MSFNNPVIVSGEAPETDSEDETATPTIAPSKQISTVQGAIVFGEDSESEHEFELNKPTASPVQVHNSGEHRNHNSLLHRKLRECNHKLRWDIETFTRATTDEVCKTLQQLEQELINSQLTAQSAISSLQSLSANCNKINKRMQWAISSSFLSNMRV